MARIFDVVEYASEMKDELVHRFPEEGIADLRLGSQVIVRESQKAVFFGTEKLWTFSVLDGIRSQPQTSPC